MPHPVLDAPISPLRQRLIDDMTLRRFSQETRHHLPQAPGRAVGRLWRRVARRRGVDAEGH